MKWLTDIFNKRDSLFIQLEFNEFYPSINEDILTNAIRFAKLHIIIDDKNLRLNMHCVENPYCVAMKLGKRNQQKAALMLPWAVSMVLRNVNLYDFIFSQT